MNLQALYGELLTQYNQVLALTERILELLKQGGRASDLELLVEKKKVAARRIARLTEKIGSTEIAGHSASSLRTLAEVKDLLHRVTKKAEQLQEIEERIQNFVRKKDAQSN